MARFFCIFIYILAVCPVASGQMTPQEAVARMVRGINLGNTLEPPHENEWNNPPAQEVYFDYYRDAGFDVVRIPVRWHYHTGTSAPYPVDPDWMDRVEEVVDWGLDRGLFVVLNAHHEEWIKQDYANPSNRARFDSIWSQIATRFRDKADQLIFEIINEPYGLTKAQNEELHQRVLRIIRKSNPTRNVIVQGHNWGGADELVQMNIPDDPHLIGSFHSYDPWPFGLEGTGSFGTTSQLNELENKFKAVKQWSEETHIPVFLGEFGCNRTADYNSRMKHYRAYVNFSIQYGFSFCAWDDGGNFRILQRSTGGWDEVKDILIHSSPEAPTITVLSMLHDTVVNLGWNSGPGGHDSISVQRRGLTTGFSTIATLEPGTISYQDQDAEPGQPSYYRIIAHYPDGEVKYSNPLRIHVPVYTVKSRGPYPGSLHIIPGIIEAEDFDTGGEGTAYHDMDASNLTGAYRPFEGVDIIDMLESGILIANALPGEWYEYSVDVNLPGEYRADLYYASIYSGGRCLVSVGDVRSDTLVAISTGNWNETRSIPFLLSLEEGEQILRISITGLPLFNIDRIEFSVPGRIPGSGQGTGGIDVHQGRTGDLVVRVTGNGELRQIQLVSISGTLAGQYRCSGQEARIPARELAPGVYLVRAFTSGRPEMTRTWIH